MRALSIRQPWVHAILHLGKTVENRDAWSGSNFLGEFLIHAAKGCTQNEHMLAEHVIADACSFWNDDTYRAFPRWKDTVRGAIVGRARVAAHILPDGNVRTNTSRGGRPLFQRLTPAERRWWAGGFALLLEDIVAFPKPIPWPGSLGFFEVGVDRHGRVRLAEEGA